MEQCLLRWTCPATAVKFWGNQGNGAGQRVLVGYEDGAVVAWNVRSRRCLNASSPSTGKGNGVVSLHTLCQTDAWVVQKQRGTIDVVSEEGVKYTCETGRTGFARCSALFVGSRTLLATGGDAVTVWDVANGTSIATMKADQGRGMAMDTRLVRINEGRLYAIASYEDGSIRVYDVDRQSDIDVDISALSDVCLTFDILAKGKSGAKYKGAAAGASSSLCAFALDFDAHRAMSSDVFP